MNSHMHRPPTPHIRRPSSADARRRRPQKPPPPLSPLPDIPDPDMNEEEPVRHPVQYRTPTDPTTPCSPLDADPLDLICGYLNVKRVSLEEGVPPPPKLDLPLVHAAFGDNDTTHVLPTHILAVYDKDSDVSSSAPRRAPVLLIPVNAEAWGKGLTTPFKDDRVSRRLSTGTSSRDPRRRPDPKRSGPATSPMSRSAVRTSVLMSVPIILFPVPHAPSLPLLLLCALGFTSPNHIASSLLPQAVLEEFPAPTAILAQTFCRLGQEQPPVPPVPSIPPVPPLPSLPPRSKSRPPSIRTASAPLSNTEPNTPTSPALHSDSRNPDGQDRLTVPGEPKKDPFKAKREADNELQRLMVQNQGLWQNVLALGVRDFELSKLIEIAFAVTMEAKKLRFGELAPPIVTRRSRSTPSLKR